MRMIGHTRIHEALLRAQEKGALAHAYVFAGPAHVGKATLARLWMERLCPGTSSQTHPDVSVLERLVDEETGELVKTLKVDQVRELCERLSQSALNGGYKVALIEEAELLQPEAANALLKTLEEPKGKTVIFLCTVSPERLPATIVSRCQLMRFAPVPTQEIQSALTTQYGLSKEEAVEFAALALGRPGIAVALVKDALLRSRLQTRVQGFANLALRSVPGRLSAAATLGKQKDWQETLNDWEEVLRDALLQKTGCEKLMVHRSHATRLREATARLSARRVMDALTSLRETRAAAWHAVNPALALEHVLLNL